MSRWGIKRETTKEGTLGIIHGVCSKPWAIPLLSVYRLLLSEVNDKKVIFMGLNQESKLSTFNGYVDGLLLG